MKFGTLLILGLMLGSQIAFAEMYRYEDDQGNITYSNFKRGEQSEPVFEKKSQPVSSPRAAKPPTLLASVNFPKVDSATQSSRDQERKRILQDELAGEEGALTQAKEKNDSAAINRHADNIAALKREINNVK